MTADPCTSADLIREATPIVLAVVATIVAPVVAYVIGRLTPRPEEHIAVAANERLKGELADARRASGPPTQTTVVVEAPQS
jgi:hypothetical protein